MNFGKRTREEVELEEKVFGGSDLATKFVKTVPVKKKKKAKRNGSKKKEEKKQAWDDPSDKDSDLSKQMSVPTWALKRDSARIEAEDDSDTEDQMRRTGDAKAASTILPPTILQLKLCTDLTKDSPMEGKLKAIEFHPWARMAFAAGMGNRLAIFEVDGKRNPCLTSLFLDKYPVYSAHFTSDGSEIVIGSRHRKIKVFDLNVGKMLDVPCLKSMEESNMKHFQVSPEGRFLAFRGSYGNIHLLSQKSKQWIDTIKMNGNVESIAFSPDGSRLFSHGTEGEVYVWDLDRRSCIHRFYDDGCVSGLSVAMSPNGQYLAAGSSRAAVNLYKVETCLASRTPKPLKVFLNLRYQITDLVFNSTSEILAMSSNYAESAVRLAHTSSQTVFSNFPEPHTKTLRIPFSMAFSTNSGYFAIGMNTGRALLYRLKHYGSY